MPQGSKPCPLSPEIIKAATRHGTLEPARHPSRGTRRPGPRRRRRVGPARASSNSRSSSVRARGGGAHENSAAIAAPSVADDHVDTVGPYHLRARDRHCLRHRRCSLPGGDLATLRCDPRHACRLPRDCRDVASASTRGERSMRSELIPIPSAAEIGALCPAAELVPALVAAAGAARPSRYSRTSNRSRRALRPTLSLSRRWTSAVAPAARCGSNVASSTPAR
jgi:hypothetical protein